MHQLNDFRLLDAVAQFGSIRKAAEHLSLTSSALSRKILALEAYFGVDLFERTSKGLRLNSSGEYLAVHARAQLAELDKVRSELQAIQRTLSGHVRICASQSVLESFLPAHLATFQINNPKVTAAVNHSSSSRALADLQEFHSDIGLCLNLPDHPDLTVLGSADQEIYAVVAANHPLAGAGEVTLGELAQHRVVLPPRGSGLRLMLDQQAHQEGCTLIPTVESNTYASIASACRAGGLITFGLSVYAQGGFDPEDPNGVALLKIKGSREANVRIVKLRERTLSPAASKLAQFLAKILRKSARSPSEATP